MFKLVLVGTVLATAYGAGHPIHQDIVDEIKADFERGYTGIVQLPHVAKFGVYTAYRYYYKLLKKLQDTPSTQIKKTRIRVSNYQKFGLLAKSYVNCKLHLV